MSDTTATAELIRGGRPCKAIIDGNVLEMKHKMDHLAMAMTHAEIYAVEAFTEKELAGLLDLQALMDECVDPWIARIESALPAAFAARAA